MECCAYDLAKWWSWSPLGYPPEWRLGLVVATAAVHIHIGAAAAGHAWIGIDIDMYLLLILLHIIADADMLMLVLVLILLVAGHAGNVWSQFDYAESKIYRTSLGSCLFYRIYIVFLLYFCFCTAQHTPTRFTVQLTWLIDRLDASTDSTNWADAVDWLRLRLRQSAVNPLKQRELTAGACWRA